MALPRPLLHLMVLIGAAAAVLILGASSASAAGYKKCGLTQSEQQPSGTKPKPTYNLSLKQQRTTCATAKRVMKAFHSCRALTSYRCTKRVRTHWRCIAKKTSSTTGIFYATFTCTWSARRVQSTYQQNVPGA